jgi:hypothetical protein
MPRSHSPLHSQFPEVEDCAECSECTANYAAGGCDQVPPGCIHCGHCATEAVVAKTVHCKQGGQAGSDNGSVLSTSYNADTDPLQADTMHAHDAHDAPPTTGVPSELDSQLVTPSECAQCEDCIAKYAAGGCTNVPPGCIECGGCVMERKQAGGLVCGH